MLIRLVVLAATALGAAGALVAQQRTYLPAEIENGGRVYQANCAGCHGPEGDGVAGIDFGSGRLRRASSDDDLVRIIMGGIPGTAMPPSNFSDGQAGTIVAYLRSMATGPISRSAPAAGDIGRGRAVFEGKGQCLTCHAVGGSGARRRAESDRHRHRAPRRRAGAFNCRTRRRDPARRTDPSAR